MVSEIEETIPDSPPRHVNPHNDNTMKNDNREGEKIDCNNNGEREKEKIKDGRKGTSTIVPCWRGLKTRRSVKGSSKKKDKQVGIGSKERDSRSNPLEQQFDDILLPDNRSQDEFKGSQSLKDFCKRFEVLGSPQKRCLLSFTLFPENTVLKKSLLVYYWIAEGFLDVLKKEEKAFEDIANGILDELTSENFIIPVYKHCQKVASSFKMDPHVPFLLGKSDSTSDGNLPSSIRDGACLRKSEGKAVDNLEEVETMLNISQGHLDYRLERFSKMKIVKVLYLGRWQSWDEHHHIDVTNSEFLKGLKNMEKLRFLSLQGISGIQELPISISSLKRLKILDLRACYNLEKLPKEIGSLKKLIHLDISECYLLDCMPKELLSLSDLQVLKGFVITDTKNKSFCTLEELSELKKLTKLSVNLNSATFSIDKFSVVLKFNRLLKLKITWGAKVSIVEQNKNSKQENNEAKSKPSNLAQKGIHRLESAVGVRSSGTKLEKLELNSLPHKTLPNWVSPENLRTLKKLYIRGGGLQSLGRIDQEDWKLVEALRLKYLTLLTINWRELMTMFPKLQYVEKFKCPKAVLFPCDCYGVWVKSPQN